MILHLSVFKLSGVLRQVYWIYLLHKLNFQIEGNTVYCLFRCNHMHILGIFLKLIFEKQSQKTLIVSYLA